MKLHLHVRCRTTGNSTCMHAGLSKGGRTLTLGVELRFQRYSVQLCDAVYKGLPGSCTAGRGPVEPSSVESPRREGRSTQRAEAHSLTEMGATSAKGCGWQGALTGLRPSRVRVHSSFCAAPTLCWGHTPTRAPGASRVGNSHPSILTCPPARMPQARSVGALPVALPADLLTAQSEMAGAA